MVKRDNGDMVKPFRLVKFFSFTSLVVILVTSLVLSFVISNYAKDVLLERSKAYTLVLAENVGHQVFQQFVLPLALQNRQIAVEDPRQFRQLDLVVRSATHGTNIASVTIFSKKENQVSYSTIRELVGKKDIGKEEYEKALTGESVSVLQVKGPIFSFLWGSDKTVCQMRTFIPLRKEKPFSPTEDVMGVIEIVQDLTDEVEDLIQMQSWIIFVSLVIMGGLFFTLRFIVARADRIIAARAEERSRLEVKLNQAERLASLGKMVASVSHEIKNPLGIIRSTAEILGKRLAKSAPENGRLADIIVQETSRLDRIVREFLDFARPQQPRLKEIDINEVLIRVLDFMVPEFADRHIEVTTNYGPDLPRIQGDFDLLYQAFLNILVNAVQAIEEGGTIFITTCHAVEKKCLAVTVADTGTGMSADMLAQIFTPFYTNKTRGTGLGLAIVKNIIDAHHAKISAVSEEGHGTEFIMEFPV
ncbi:MAG: two-component system sensor histidine kinase NtrB [Thermodesulfobacteriota bacterium]